MRFVTQNDIWSSACSGDLIRLRQHIKSRKKFQKSAAPLDPVCPWSGLSPLHFAAVNGQLEACKMLLEHGSSIHIRSKTEGKTALHFACENRREKVVRFLLNCYSSNAELETDIHEYTPLHYACLADSKKIVTMFLGKYESVVEWIDVVQYSERIQDLLNKQHA